MGLTAEQKKVVLADWEKAKNDKRKLGVEIFITLFETYPKHQDLFRDYKGQSRASLEKCVRLQAHGYRVVDALDAAITNLDDPEFSTNTLELIGQGHKKHNLAVSHFEDLKKSIPKALARCGVSGHEEAWAVLLNWVIPVIQRGLEAASLTH